MPDYKRIGQALMSLSHSCVTDEFRSPPEINETELLEGCFSPDVMDRHVVELGPYHQQILFCEPSYTLYQKKMIFSRLK